MNTLVHLGVAVINQGPSNGKFYVVTKGKVTGVFDVLFVFLFHAVDLHLRLPRSKAALSTLGVPNNSWRVYATRLEAETAYSLAMEGISCHNSAARSLSPPERFDINDNGGAPSWMDMELSDTFVDDIDDNDEFQGMESS